MRTARPRHLAAVMFTDIVGYTTMVGDNEARARHTRARLRTLLDDVLAARGGTLIQGFGDGTLSVFASAVEAASAATEIQTALAGEAGVALRIGIHMGEVAYDDDGIYGDAVNIASRIQVIATPGSVLVTEEVTRQLRNHRELPFTAVGRVTLKNVTDPVRVYALALEPLAIPTTDEIARRAAEASGTVAGDAQGLPDSLAVLPLANLSGEAAQNYFVEGMHEAMLTELARIRALKVISRTSVMRYRDTTESLPEIAAALGVEALIEGSVLRAGERVRITAQLIAFHPERHLWAESYDGDVKDVLALHRRVALAIASAVQSTLRPVEQKRLASRQNVDPDAYDAYLRGRFAAGRVSEGEALTNAIEWFASATAIDPTFAPPWVGIARALGYQAIFGYADRAQTVERASEAIGRALTLDPDLAEALAVRGQMNLVFNADGSAAVRDLERAVAQEPNSVPMLLDYGMALNAESRYADSARAFDRAAERDPLSPTTAMMRGWGRFIGRSYEEARQILEQGTRVTPDFSYNQLWLAAALLLLGLVAEARDAAGRAQELEGDTEDVNFLCVIAWIWATAGERQRALAIRAHLLSLRLQGKPVDATFLVVLEAGLGDADAAFLHMKDAIAARSPILFHLPTHPMIDSLRPDPRFESLLAEGGLSL
jgi:TolB-like protein/Tfp pilus assembly protein PilF